MRTIGMIASAAGVGVLLAATAVVVKSLPDVAHYRRIRNM